MKKNTTPLIIATWIAIVGAAQAAVIYNHDFVGAGSTDLHGLATDTGSGTWDGLGF